MVIASEVGAAFLIDDQATGTLDRISAALSRAEVGLDAATAAAKEFSDVRFGNVTRSLSALYDRLDQVLVAADKLSSLRFTGLTTSVRALDAAMVTVEATVNALPTTFDSAMNRVISHAQRATQAIHGLSSAMFQANTQAAGIGSNLGHLNVPGGGGRGGGGGGGGPGRGGGGGGGGPHGRVHLSPYGVGAAAGMGVGMGGLVGMGLGFLAYEAVKGGAEYDQGLRNAAMNLGVEDPDSPEGVAVRGILDETMRQSTTGTQFGLAKTAPALADFYGVVGSGITGTPEEKARKLQGLTSQALRFSEAEVKMGHGTLETNMQTGGEFSHLFRVYDPEKMGHIYDKLLSISRMTGKDPLELERIMKYIQTTGELFGVDPDEIMSMTGFAIQSGQTGTTAGTGLARVLTQIGKGEKPDPKEAHAAVQELHQRRDFNRAMHGQVGIDKELHGKTAKTKEGTKALIELGLLGSDHQLLPQFRTPTGGIDEVAVLLQIARKAGSMPGHKGGILIETALGVQGARQVAPYLGDGGEIFERYIKAEKHFTDKQGVGVTQAGQAGSPMGEFQQLGARLGDFGTTLVTSTGLLSKLGDAALGAANSLNSATEWIKKHDWSTGPWGMTSPRDAIHGTMHPGEGPHNSYGLGGTILDGLKTMLGIPVEHPMVNPSGPRPIFRHPADPHPGSGGGPADDVLHHSSYSAPGGSTVHIQNINFGPGTAKDHAEQFAEELGKLLNRGQQHDLGPGGGHSSSGYTAGRTLSI